MAQPLKYIRNPEQVHTDPAVSAEEEWQALLETLHTSGTLRVLRGLFGGFEGVSTVAAEALDTPGGHNALGNVSVLLRLLSEVDPDRLAVLTGAAAGGVTAAHEAMAEDDAPGIVSLLGALKDADTRRGLHAVLAFLRAFGGRLESPGTSLTPVNAHDTP